MQTYCCLGNRVIVPKESLDVKDVKGLWGEMLTLLEMNNVSYFMNQSEYSY